MTTVTGHYHASRDTGSPPYLCVLTHVRIVSVVKPGGAVMPSDDAAYLGSLARRVGGHPRNPFNGLEPGAGARYAIMHRRRR